MLWENDANQGALTAVGMSLHPSVEHKKFNGGFFCPASMHCANHFGQHIARIQCDLMLTVLAFYMQPSRYHISGIGHWVCMPRQRSVPWNIDLK